MVPMDSLNALGRCYARGGSAQLHPRWRPRILSSASNIRILRSLRQAAKAQARLLMRGRGGRRWE
jgi:hypothetical protein